RDGADVLNLTIGRAWRAVRDRFRAAGLDTPELDARLLAQHVLACDSLGLLSREADAMPAEALAQFTALADRRLEGEPVSRLVGHRAVYGPDSGLNHAPLVPRPETELLVDVGIERLAAAGASQILDLGTGSGAIAVALLVNLAQARAVATDLSAEALAMAGRN